MELIIHTSTLPTKGAFYKFRQISCSAPEITPAEPIVKPAPTIVPGPDRESPWVFPFPKKDSPPKGFFF